MPEVDLAIIHPNKLNPRLEISIKELNELAESIRKKGLLQPLIVRPSKDGYEVVVGERRYRACQQVGLKQVSAIIRDYTDEEVIELNLIENIQRQDLSAVEKAKACKLLRDRFPARYPTWKKIADFIGVDVDTVKSWVKTLDLPEEVQKLVAPRDMQRVPEGKIDYKTAIHVADRIEEPELQTKVAKEIAERRIPHRAAIRVIEEVAEEPERPIEEAIKEVVEAPPEMAFRLAHMGTILNGLQTQTSKRGILDPKIKVGAIVHASIWEPHFADLRITSIEHKKLRDFLELDAKREGEKTLEDFKKSWESEHGKGSWDPDEWVYIIEFEVVKDQQPKESP